MGWGLQPFEGNFVSGILALVTYTRLHLCHVILLSDTFDLNGYEYDISSMSLTWNESKEWCEEWGGELASILTPAEQEFLVEKIVNKFQCSR